MLLLEGPLRIYGGYTKRLAVTYGNGVERVFDVRFLDTDLVEENMVSVSIGYMMRT